MKRYSPLLLILATHLISSHPVMAHRQSAGSITGVVHTRERAKGDESLLIGINAPSGGVDEVEFKLDAKLNYSSGFLMRGWTIKRDGKKVTAQGTPSDQVKIRLDFSSGSTGKDDLEGKLGEKVEVEARRDGKTVFKEDIPVTPLPKVEVLNSLDGALDMPFKLTPGEPFLATANEAFTGGTWAVEVDGKGNNFGLGDFAPRGGGINVITKSSDIKTNDYTGILTSNFFQEGQYSEKNFTIGKGAAEGNTTRAAPVLPSGVEMPPGVIGGRVPKGATPNDTLRIGYIDEWGERLIDVKADHVEIAPGLSHTNCAPTITGSAPRIFEGNPLCICGCFYAPNSWFSLNLDGKPIGVPAAASSSTIVYRIPARTAPGEHSISWHKSAESASGEVKFFVLKVVGTINQRELWTGQSTKMTLRVEGTEDKMPLEIENKTPKVIEIEGGAKQVIDTSGGADNKIERNVRGIHRGNFTIDFKLDEAPCPCQEQPRGQQPPPGDLSGKVTDSNGGALPGSSINIINTRTGEQKTVITDAQGKFRFSGLPPGDYQIKTSLEGFNTVLQKVTIGSDSDRTATIELNPSTQTEELIVTAESPVIDDSSSLQPQPCDSLQGRVPEAVLREALAKPYSVTGFGAPANPNLPVSASNPKRTRLSLQDPSKPYHPVYNRLIYKASCN